jgi:glycosyltransferase involved in cell wall biosynthesis
MRNFERWERSQTNQDVLLDLSFLASPLTGVGHYSIELARALLEQKERPSISALLASNWGYHQVLLQSGRFDAQMQNSMRCRQDRPVWQHRLGATIGRARLARSGKVLIHAFNYFSFLGRVERTIPVVYDMSVMRHPSFHPPDRVAYFKRNIGRIIDAPVVHTISEFSRREIIALTGVDASRITVIPPGHEHILRGVAEPLPEVLRKGEPYLLVVGAHDPRKNIGVLLNALRTLHPTERRDFRIVLAGTDGWGEKQQIESELSDHILEINNPTPGLLRGLYAGASGLLFPSIYEGFGMPVLEALAHGLPVAVTAETAAAEVAEGICITAAANDPAAWARAMTDMLSLSSSERALKEECARMRASHFTWAGAAAKTLGLYQDAAAHAS